MDSMLVALTFFLGFAVRQVGLPPLVGFLVAGFILNEMGVVVGNTLQILADLGVTLLLFTIGLKLNIRGLLKPEIWLGTSLHMLAILLIFAGSILCLAAAGVAMFAGLDLKSSLVIAFALSFSSTVFAVKVMEEKGEMSSFHGLTAIGILIMQDVVAVVFLSLSTGKIPSPWAIAVIGLLFAIRPLLFKILDRCGHGELTIIFGFFLVMVIGSASFDAVHLKADLGALFIGILMSSHPKSSEVAASLFGFKELFLVFFFLSIGLSGSLSLKAIGASLIFLILLPVKTAVFFLLLTRFKLRVRTAVLSSLSLSSYSEFGLIVCALAANNGWIATEWLIVTALSVSFSYVLAAPVNKASNVIHLKLQERLTVFETKQRHPDDRLMDPGPVSLAIFGMGKLGTSVYDFLRSKHGDIVVGLDFDDKVIARQQTAGRNVIYGDATDADLWERGRARAREKGRQDRITTVILCMPNHQANLYAVKQLQESGFSGKVAAIAMYADEVENLKKEGVHAAFNFYAEAGAGFARHVDDFLIGPETPYSPRNLESAAT